jgi:hypothetical protein
VYFGDISKSGEARASAIFGRLAGWLAAIDATGIFVLYVTSFLCGGVPTSLWRVIQVGLPLPGIDVAKSAAAAMWLEGQKAHLSLEEGKIKRREVRRKTERRKVKGM